MTADATRRRRVLTDLAVAASIIAIIGFVLLGIVWLNYPFLARAIAFEDSPIAWLQSSVLVAGATMCIPLATSAPHERRSVAGWCVISALLLIAALDERFMFHENVARWMLHRVFDGDLARMGRLGTLPMLGYVLAGIFTARWLWRAARSSRPWNIAAVVIGASAVVMDIRNDAVAPQIVEELLELAAETLFLCGLVIAYRNSRA